MKGVKVWTAAMLFALFTTGCNVQDLLGQVPEDGSNGDLIEQIAGVDVTEGSDVAPIDGDKFSGVGGTDLTTDEARMSARDSLADGLTNAMQKAAGSVDSVVTMIDGGSSTPDTSSAAAKLLMQQKDAVGALSKAMGKLAGRETAATANDGSVAGAVIYIFDSVFVVEDHNENVITYKMDQSVCNDDTGCMAVMDKVRVVQTMFADDTGVLVLRYDNFKPIALGYSPDEWFLQADLGQIKSAVDALSVAANLSDVDKPQLPSTMEGLVRLTLAQPAVDQMEANLGVIAPVRVIETGEVDLSVGVGKLLHVAVNDTAKTLSAKVNVGAVDATFADYSEEYNDLTMTYDEIKHMMAFSISKITGELVVDGTAQEIRVNGLSIGTGIQVKADNEPLIDITAADIAGVASITNKTIETTNAIDVKVVYNHVAGFNDGDFEGQTADFGSIQVTADAATMVEMTSIPVDVTETDSYGTTYTYTEDHTVIKVLAGQMSILGAGVLDADVTLAVDTCHDMDVDGPPALVECPLVP